MAPSPPRRSASSGRAWDSEWGCPCVSGSAQDTARGGLGPRLQLPPAHEGTQEKGSRGWGALLPRSPSEPRRPGSAGRCHMGTCPWHGPQLSGPGRRQVTFLMSRAAAGQESQPPSPGPVSFRTPPRPALAAGCSPGAAAGPVPRGRRGLPAGTFPVPPRWHAHQRLPSSLSFLPARGTCTVHGRS